MVDVRGDDGAARRQLAPHKLRSYLRRNSLRKPLQDRGMRRIYDIRSMIYELAAARVLFVEVMANVVLLKITDPQARRLRYLHILADGDEFHLRRDDALA